MPPPTAVIKDFARIGTARPGVLPERTALNLDAILSTLERGYDAPALEAALAALAAHVLDPADPHQDLERNPDGTGGFLNILYYDYADTTATPMPRAEFQQRLAHDNVLLMELFRRLILNAYQYMDGVGTVAPETRYAGVVLGTPGPVPPLVLSLAPWYGHGRLTPDANAATSGRFYLPLGGLALPYPALSLTLRAGFGAAPEADQEIVRLENLYGESLVISRRAGTAARVRVVFLGQGPVPTPAAAIDAYLDAQFAADETTAAGEQDGLVADFTQTPTAALELDVASDAGLCVVLTPTAVAVQHLTPEGTVVQTDVANGTWLRAFTTLTLGWELRALGDGDRVHGLSLHAGALAPDQAYAALFGL